MNTTTLTGNQIIRTIPLDDCDIQACINMREMGTEFHLHGNRYYIRMLDIDIKKWSLMLYLQQIEDD